MRRFWRKIPRQLRFALDALLVLALLTAVYVAMGCPILGETALFRRAEKANLMGPSKIIDRLDVPKDWPTVKWLADPSYSNMMLLCFTIGVSHLMLARIWSGIQIINDRTCIAQFGWAGVLLFMYIVTNSIVGIFGGVPQWAFWMFGVSLVMVFGFTLKGSELKSRGIELGMLPLNIMSALGDIISYVRLFAVGLASVKVAENFNSMATGLVAGADSMALKAVMCVAMVAILIVGHGLNLALAGLSILVHAVRLNTLEFSNHKGVSWAGYAFSPFRKN